MEGVFWSYVTLLGGVWRDRLDAGGFDLPIAFFLIAMGVTYLVRGRLGDRPLLWSVLGTVGLYLLNFASLPLLYLLRDGIQAGYDALGVPALPAATWHGVPGWALCLVAVVLYDFADYWNHRLLHLEPFWAIHAIHHADAEVNPLTTYRVHALEPLVMGASYALLLSWLNLPLDAVGFAAALLVLHNMYVHADLDWDHGPLRLLLASPRFHRWHHADVEEAYGKNLANVFPLFDWLFGTYYCPGPCRARLGMVDGPGDNPLALALYPFARWLAQGRHAVARGLGSLRRLAPTRSATPTA